MEIKPILFNIEMVKAILDGRKTVTRRVVKPQPIFVQRIEWNDKEKVFDFFCVSSFKKWIEAVRPPYQPGDALYVRETWDMLPSERYLYKADHEDWFTGTIVNAHTIKWRPSIHMPKEAARIWLKVTKVQVERLQEIDSKEAIREGIYWKDVTPAVPSLPDNPEYDMDSLIGELQQRQERELVAASFGKLWNSTIKKDDLPKYGWNANPWCWVVSFQRMTKTFC